jgi:hypothetical protein
MATTAYVATAVTNGLGTLGTMATQNSNNVTITGGTINGVSGTNASLTVGNATNATTAATVSTTVASGAVGTTQATATNNTQIATTAFVQAVKQTLYPIGSIYSSTAATNPGDASMLGFGTWIQFAAGRVLVGAGGTFSGTGGSADAVVISHTHNGSTSSASNDHIHGVYGNVDTTILSGGVYGISESFNSGGGFATGVFTKQTGYSVAFTPVQNDPGDGGAFEMNASHSHPVSIQSAGQSASHTHTFTTDSAGTAGTNLNMQPYVVVYMWTRTS